MEATAYRQFQELERVHWWFRGRRKVYLGLLEKHLGGKKPERILDVGSGLGGFLPGLEELGGHVYYTDIDHESLVHCRSRGFEGGAVADGYALPYRNETMDLVCMFDALEHIPDDARTMREVARVLAPDGLVLVSVPAYQFLYSNNDRIARHHRRYVRRSLRELFEQAGLRVERSTHTNVFLFPAILPAVLALKAFEALRPTRREHTNLSWTPPGPLNSALYLAFAAELPFSRHLNWPVGHSIMALARKPARASG